MKPESAEYILNKLGMDTQKRSISGVWHNFRCPFAPWYHDSGADNNPSFGVSVDETGQARSYYKCLSCGQKGSLALLPAKIGKLRGEDLSALVMEAERIEYSEVGVSEAPEWDGDGGKTEKRARKEKKRYGTFGTALHHPYLRKRGFTWIDAWRMGLRYDEIQQRILFPIFNNRLQLEGYNGRSVMPKHRLSKPNPKSRDYGSLNKKELFLFHPAYYGRPDPREKLIIVEGGFDYARGVQADFMGTHCNLGTSITPEKRDYLLQLGRPVMFFFDNDVAGDAALIGNINKVSGVREDRHNAWAYALYQTIPVWICTYPPSAVEEGRNDPGSLTADEFRWGVKNAWLFNGSDPEAHESADAYGF